MRNETLRPFSRYSVNFIKYLSLHRCIGIPLHLCLTIFIMAKPRGRKTDPRTNSLQEKLKQGGVKVKHYKEKQVNSSNLGSNRNQAFTSNGRNNQGYDKETKQFTKASTSTRNGLLAVEGSTNTKGAKTHTMSYRDENGERKSGRNGQLATRSQRMYDVKAGFNNMTEKVARTMLQYGQITQREYDKMFGPGGSASGGTASLGQSNG